MEDQVDLQADQMEADLKDVHHEPKLILEAKTVKLGASLIHGSLTIFLLEENHSLNILLTRFDGAEG